MRICLATNGTRGDVFPFLAIGRELQARGHEVSVLTHPYFAGDAAEAGIDLFPLAPRIDLDAIIRDPDLFHHRRGGRVVFGWVKRSIPDAVESFREMVRERRPDVMVSHHFMLGARQICAGEGIPYINACLAPCAWLARDDPAPALQRSPGALRAAGGRAMMGLVRPIAGVAGDAFFGRELRRAGLRHGGDVFVGAFRGGQLNLGLWSRHFRGPCADDPPGGVITGFAWYDGHPGARLDPELERFLDSGEPPVVFSMGSAAHHSAGEFYEMAAGACAELGVRGVLLTGEPGRRVRGLGADVLAVAYAPFGLVFPRAAVTVHHGGIGSVAQALRAGRPTLVVPRAHDQFNNGVHVERLGLGRTRPLHRLRPRALTRALGALLDDGEMEARAGTMGERVREEDGTRVAGDYVEAFGAGQRQCEPRLQAWE